MMLGKKLRRGITKAFIAASLSSMLILEPLAGCTYKQSISVQQTIQVPKQIEGLSKEKGKLAIWLLQNKHGYNQEETLTILDKMESNISRAREISAKIGKENDETIMNFSFALSTIGEEKTRVLYNELGIEFFMRYSQDSLEEVYRNYFSKASIKPLLLVVFNKNDSNNAFYSVGQSLNQLLGSYRIIISETDIKNGFYSIIEKSAKRLGKIDLLVIGGHGTNYSILLGEENENGQITIGDGPQLMTLRNMFTETPTVILIACSSGALDDYSVGAMISRALNALVFAPKKDTATKGYTQDSNGKVSDVIYKDSSTRLYKARELPQLAKLGWPGGYCVEVERFTKAFRALVDKCGRDPVCFDNSMRKGFNDRESPLYHESFSAKISVGDTIFSFIHMTGNMNLKLVGIDDHGIELDAYGRAYMKTTRDIEGKVYIEFKLGEPRIERFRIGFDESVSSTLGHNKADYSGVGIGNTDVWNVMRYFLHVKSFKVEKTEETNAVKITIHQRRYCDISWGSSY